MQPDCTTPPLKTCTKCGDTKTHGEFSRNSSTKDGLQSQCKTCAAAYRAEHAEEYAAYQAVYRAEHSEEKAAHDAAYRAEHRDEAAAYFAAYRAAHREEKSSYMAAYYASHRDERAVAMRAYSAGHAEDIAAYKKVWRAGHSEEIAACNRNREARKLGNGGTHTAADIRAQYARQKGTCFWCHEKVRDTYHVDHVMPVILGGSNGPENLVIACPTCNLSKGAKHPQDFAGRLL